MIVERSAVPTETGSNSTPELPADSLSTALKCEPVVEQPADEYECHSMLPSSRVSAESQSIVVVTAKSGRKIKYFGVREQLK